MEPCPFQPKLEKQGKSDPRKLLYSGKMEHPNFDIKICLILQETENLKKTSSFFSKENVSYISENGNPKTKLFYISGAVSKAPQKSYEKFFPKTLYDNSFHVFYLQIIVKAFFCVKSFFSLKIF